MRVIATLLAHIIKFNSGSAPILVDAFFFVGDEIELIQLQLSFRMDHQLEKLIY